MPIRGSNPSASSALSLNSAVQKHENHEKAKFQENLFFRVFGDVLVCFVIQIIINHELTRINTIGCRLRRVDTTRKSAPSSKISAHLRFNNPEQSRAVPTLWDALPTRKHKTEHRIHKTDYRIKDCKQDGNPRQFYGSSHRYRNGWQIDSTPG